MSAEPSLFPVRASTIYPAPPNGADILFHCEGDRGGTYYCKGDHSGRQIRATEWFFTHLAHHVGFATPECAIVERRDANTSFFGSRQIASPASAMELHNLLMTPQRGNLASLQAGRAHTFRSYMPLTFSPETGTEASRIFCCKMRALRDGYAFSILPHVA
ncbi:HipA family kinase [Sphingomonas melonis]|uniref:HipA family kinase n=1 Tax=Sphingomonas melonis TaxID=152682 RepID=UPI003AAD4921